MNLQTNYFWIDVPIRDQHLEGHVDSLWHQTADTHSGECKNRYKECQWQQLQSRILKESPRTETTVGGV